MVSAFVGASKFIGRVDIVRKRNISRLWFNIKMKSYQYRKSHCGDKTILRPSYLHNGISYTGKMSSLYWMAPQTILTDCTRKQKDKQYSFKLFALCRRNLPKTGGFNHTGWYAACMNVIIEFKIIWRDTDNSPCGIVDIQYTIWLLSQLTQLCGICNRRLQ